MTIDFARIGAQLAAATIASLDSDSRKVKAMAETEAANFTQALAEIARLLAEGQIDPEEAAMLARIQKDAGEAVLASLAEVSRVAAHREVGPGLGIIARLVDATHGITLIGNLL